MIQTLLIKECEVVWLCNQKVLSSSPQYIANKQYITVSFMEKLSHGVVQPHASKSHRLHKELDLDTCSKSLAVFRVSVSKLIVCE